MQTKKQVTNLNTLYQLTQQNTYIHNLDPRFKLIAVIAFIVTCLSFSAKEILNLLPLFIFPLIMGILACIPLKYIAKRLVAVSPFIFFVAVFSPIFEQTAVQFVCYKVSLGNLIFFSIILKFILTVSTLIILTGSTNFVQICAALARLGLPHIFCTQLLLLQRYLLVLLQESSRLVRARELRSFKSVNNFFDYLKVQGGMGLKVTCQMLGQLLLRSIKRAERIYQAMLLRGFKGQIKINYPWQSNYSDWVFLLLCLSFFLTLCFFNLENLLFNRC